MRRRVLVFLAILAVSVAIDQGTKAWARDLPVRPAGCAVPEDVIAHRCGGVPVPFIDGYWEWELAFNTGAAFSSLRGSRVLLALIASAAVILISFMAWRTRPEEKLQRIGLALIASGALGNLIDRIRDGAVTDFVRWRVGEARWPIFNVADAALFVGVGFLVLEMLAARRRARAARTAAT